ncbi:protein DESIGUAL 2-like [Prosopis cineraria]|uniref:protein DESIGUAL 2-like n=1 Tax=Prosopis cineraria TaxID=364024 RepID=UPI00240F4DD2|nr:protein DESIGUAL 2-like [Prosopis cineraria]
MAVKGKNYGFLICIFVMIIDVVAGILGIQAEIAQSKMKHVKMWIVECRDPSFKAFELGLAATILLAVAHLIANLLGGCVCIWNKQQYLRASANKQLGMAFLIFSWVTLGVAFSMLVTGTLANTKTRSRAQCGISTHRFLSIGGILCFIHGLFTVSYYVSAAAAAREDQRSTPRPNP